MICTELTLLGDVSTAKPLALALPIELTALAGMYCMW